MDRFAIRGGVPLRGRVEASGSKNAVLALMAASLLTEDEVVFSNVPGLRDVDTMTRILEQLGLPVTRPAEGEVVLGPGGPTSSEAPYDLVRTMRASFMVLGPILARCGRARVSLPGGCAIGARPVDQHLMGLEKLGAKIELANGYVDARCERLRGTKIVFDVSTVNGTQNVLMAACLAEGVTELENCALEPEVGELIDVLVAMGARIGGRDTETLVIEGTTRLGGVRHFVAGDRIEAGTLLLAGAVTQGDVEVTAIDPGQLESLFEHLREAGLQVDVGPDRARVRRYTPYRGVRIKTAVYPGFPTDLQAQMMALLTQAEGLSAVSETIFENRFMHVPELCRMGAEIEVEGHTAFIKGASRLSGAPVMATDLRASAGLVLAGLASGGVTHVRRVYHIDRGYERIEEKLTALGARIRREQE